MCRLSYLLILPFCATLAQAAPVVPPRACQPTDGVPQRFTGDEHGHPLKVARCHQWIDRSGSYQLWLLASDDRVVGGYHLSKHLAAQLFKKQPDGTLAPQWAIHDRIADGEAGAWFSQRLTGFPDLDDKGVLTPILVLRFVPQSDSVDPEDPVADRPFAGRLKVILFHEGTKVAVRAVTGELDDERRTTATDSYFALPPAWRRHVQARLRAWATDGLFVSADGGGSFMPKHERDAALR